MISLNNVSNFTASEKAKLDRALALVNYALKDPKFQAIILNSKYDNTTDTPAEILANLQKDGTISSLNIVNMGWWANHVYHTIAEEADDVITFNRYYFDGQTDPSVANTVFHEFGHVCGYRHASSTDYLSEPYQTGNELESYLESMEPDEYAAYLAAAIAASSSVAPTSVGASTTS